MDQDRRERLKERLGSFEEKRGRTGLQIIASRREGDVAIEDVLIVGQDGAQVRGLVTRPEPANTALPVVLYAHAHGGAYDIGCRELVSGRPALIDPPYGFALADAGFLTVCVDLPLFGSRANDSEGAVAKARLWHGATLMGDMLSELATAVDAIADHPHADADRLTAMGISMGGTLAYWLAALDLRISAVVHLCTFASLRELVRTGAHDLHGHYMTVPGLLGEFDTGAIAGLVAPRPQFVGVGLKDPLTPVQAFGPAYGELQAAYDAARAATQLLCHVEDQAGHHETPAMRKAVLDFLKRGSG